MRMMRTLLAPIVEIRPDEVRTALLMFGYSLSAMTAYNIVHPVTRSAFIADLGAANLPYALLVSGLLVGVTMQAYGWLVARLPPRWALAQMLAALAGSLLVFWVLFRTEAQWVSAGFYLFGQIFGTLLLSQFWTLANEIYNPRQARRLFGFIGGGASLGGMVGSGLAAVAAPSASTGGLLLMSALALTATVLIVIAIARGERAEKVVAEGEEDRAAGWTDAWRLIRDSPDLRHIVLLVGFAAGGAIILDQQLNMAAEEFRGGDENSITAFLASVRFVLSVVALVIQVFLVKQIYRLLGVGIALLILPVSLGLTASIVLLSGALWAPALASIVDRSIRYTVDRTTREFFFLPLPPTLRRRVKAFVDVTVDRAARGFAAALVLLLIKPWGLSLSWPHLSVGALILAAAWLVMAVRAKRRYIQSVRQGFDAQTLEPDDGGVHVADLTTIETLLEELAHPDERRVLYAIDVLESLDRRNLVTPLLLHHESAAVRARAVAAMGGHHPAVARRWKDLIQRLVDDPDPEVRARAIATLASIEDRDAVQVARGLLASSTPRVAASAAVVLAGSSNPSDRASAEETLTALIEDGGDDAADVRRDVAAAIQQIGSQRCRHLLIPLLQDPNPEVAGAAMRSVRALHPLDDLFVPTLISLLGDRRLKSAAREALASYGEAVLDRLGHALGNPGEDTWVRRHIPATMAQIPCQKTVDLLVSVLDDRDRFLRYKAVAALETVYRRQEQMRFPTAPLEMLLLRDARVYFEYWILEHDVFDRGGMPRGALLARILTEKRSRAVTRAYRLLGLLYPWRDVLAARWAIEQGSDQQRAGAIEYLDNVLSPALRQIVVPMLEEMPTDTKVQRGHRILGTHPRSVEDSLLALINDGDEVVAAAAIELVRQQRSWNLTHDIEHVLAHRDARDWLVFEAASWTLAATRLTPDQQRVRWLEPIPSIVLADRLRTLPMFRSVQIEELCRLLASGQQIRHEDGDVLHEEGRVPDGFHLLLDGRVTVASRGAPSHAREAPDIAGFEDVLQERPSQARVTAAGPVVTLEISRDDLLTVLMGNTELVRGLFHTIALSAATDRTPSVVRGTAIDASDAAGGTLTLVQRALALQHVSLLSDVPSEELTQLASIAEPIPLEAGAQLFSDTDPLVVCVILSGELALTTTAGTVLDRAGPGDAVGLFDALAGPAVTRREREPSRLVVTSAGAALRLDREDLFDLIAHRPVLLQRLFGALFSIAA